MSNNEVIERLKRIETKIVRFAEELGVDTDVNHDWLTVDDDARIVYVSTLGRSFIVMQQEAVKRGATRKGRYYDLVHQGNTYGTILIS